jgi:hypothetical protein
MLNKEVGNGLSHPSEFKNLNPLIIKKIINIRIAHILFFSLVSFIPLI